MNSYCNILSITKYNLETGGVSKTDEFSEKLQIAFDTPPHFPKIPCCIFVQFAQKALFKGPKSAT